MCGRFLLILSIFVLCSFVKNVDRSNFKTCDQSGFCKRHRNIQQNQSPYYIEPEGVKIHPTKAEAVLVNGHNGATFKVELIALKYDTFRLKITEHSPLRIRFEALDALVSEPEVDMKLVSQDSEKVIVSMGKHKAVLVGKPFRVDIYSDDQLVVRANGRGLMKYEHYRRKEHLGKGILEELVFSTRKNSFGKTPFPKLQCTDLSANGVRPPNPEGGDENVQVHQQIPSAPEDEQFADTLWEESFKGKTDSKPFGPSSVGMDFSFVGFKHVYGIPEHADLFPLKQTKGVSDPYRLYNLDVFEYEINSPMAIYGSIPFMIAHSAERSVGMLWLNAAETWVDIEAPSNQGVVSSIVDFVKGSTPVSQRDTHWFSESGIIDTYFMLGPHPKDVMYQYSKLTGVTPLPPLFALAYHQCRWNYRDQDDVRNVDAGFDGNDIPYDVLWLDVDHTNDRKYFTWDPYKFPSPVEMLTNLTGKARKMVTLVDPHIKRDSGYYIHQIASDKGYYVKNKDGQDYEGWCWPGSSGYLDYLSPEVRDWWASQYALDKYQGSTLSLYTWNDMNEPSVFSEPEVTMPKDAKHFGGWEHRDVHNIYGMLMVRATYKGHLMRCDSQQRPFILSRAMFVGSQRYGAVWTGDNIADWGHLQMSIPMVLSLSVSGMTLTGADVGGFFRNPSSDLLVRWYQAGAFQPFFRAHSHHETKRREPWLFDDTTHKLIRDAIRLRYSMLPIWYTLFHENEFNGVPPMRPIWMEYPTETETFDFNDEYMIGNLLLVRPVMESGVSSVNVYFPGQNEVWYDIIQRKRYDGHQSVSIPVTLDKIPVYQRGGTIIATKERIRRSSSLTYDDPYTLTVALNKDGKAANGTLYIDDFHTFQYREGNYLLLNLSFRKNSLSSSIVGGPGKFTTKAWLERIHIIGLPHPPKSISISSKSITSKDLMFVYDKNSHILTIRKPAINMGEAWKMKLHN